MSDIPEDILELKELIGAQRQQLNEKELELEYAKGEVAQSHKELELVKKQIIPTQGKLEETYETIGNLRAEMAEKSSELLLKNEAVKNLNNKTEELQAFTDKFKEEQVKLISQLENKRRIESQELKAEVSKLESTLLERKLQSTELDSDAKDAISRMESMKAKYEELINKVGELSDKNRAFNEENERLTRKVKEIYESQKENIDKIHHFDKLKPLMEKETLFKAFLIVEEVGAITLEDLRNALGSPIVLVKKMTQQLEGAGLLETNEQGKIVVKKIEEI
jgi:chromosome segregation ATPase